MYVLCVCCEKKTADEYEMRMTLRFMNKIYVFDNYMRMYSRNRILSSLYSELLTPAHT